MTRSIFTALVCCTLLSALAAARADDSLVVNTTYGLVAGHYDAQVKQWLGIPFATPPLGSYRFRPPMPPAPWSSVLSASQFGPSCMQPESSMPLPAPPSEDCLYLNVFAPNTSSASAPPLPVMVWIYGGGFTSGSASFSLYNGANLARKGNVIIVSLNYRLGVLGFIANDALAAEDPLYPTSGNYGLMDQQLAFQWVQDNIAAFGGDPTQVTIFGESAGSMSVCAHLVSPLSRGYFKRAIMESGPCIQGATPGNYLVNYTAALTMGENFIQLAGCQNVNKSLEIDCVRQINASTIIAIQSRQMATMLLGFTPVADGVLLVEDPLRTFIEGNQQPVDVLVGTVLDEGTAFVPKTLTAGEYELYLMGMFSKFAPQILAMYPVSAYPTPFNAAAAVFGDYFFHCPSRRLLNFQAQIPGVRAYQYVFQHLPSFYTCPSPWCIFSGLGVAHGSELFFLFDNLHPALTSDEAALSDTMARYWTTFATTGTPGQDFPAYILDTQQYVGLNTTITTGSSFKDAVCRFWDTMTHPAPPMPRK